MPTISDILDNLSQYKTPSDFENLVSHLKANGIMSIDDFKAVAREDGMTIPSYIQNGIKDLFGNPDEDAWNAAVVDNTIEAYQDYLDNYPNGTHRNDARNAKSVLAQKEAESNLEDEWEKLDKSNANAVRNFINNNPDSPHISEAKEILKQLVIRGFHKMDISILKQQIKEKKTSAARPADEIVKLIKENIDNKQVTVTDIMNELKEDHNFLQSEVVRQLLLDGLFVNEDFASTGIEPEYIKLCMSDQSPEDFKDAGELTKITKKECTEIYFWGIPSSGKSCALGAILSAASDGKTAKSMKKDPDCQGYGYMTRLSNLFRSDGSINRLPGSTPVDATYEMGFELEDEKGKMHPITCIDLAGELVRCMYTKNAKEKMMDDEAKTLNTLTKVMKENRTDNTKIHFFVIEYGAEDRKYRGLFQKDILQGAVDYIDKEGFFDKDTSGIYILVSKADKIKAKGEERNAIIEDYIDKNYLGFFNGLKNICKKNSIMQGKSGVTVPIIPFSLGEVCLQDFCKFKKGAANLVVQTLLERTMVKRNSFFKQMGK